MIIKLTGRTAVITGGSRGLGEAMAKALSEAGASVALVARDIKRLEQVRDAIIDAGGTADIFVADVTQESEVANLAEAVRQRFGHPQILINNAGTNVRKNLIDFSLEEFRSVLNSSLISTFLMCRAFVPDMKGSGYGFIVDNLLGIVGAVFGGWLAGKLGIDPVGGMIYTILIAIVGAVILVFLFRLITGRRA